MQIITRGLGYVYHPHTPLARRVLDNIDLKIPEQCWVAVVGRTGSGKSTLIQHFNGLLLPTEGEVQVGRHKFVAGERQGTVLYASVGLLFQHAEQQLFEETVFDDIAYGLRQLGWPEEEINKRVEQTCQLVGLAPADLTRSFLELSGGQRRRAAIAAVLILNPDLLIMDEPTSGLDPAGKKEILAFIHRWHQQQGKTVIHVTHHLDQVAQYADQVVVLDGGRLVLQSTPFELFTKHLEHLGKWGLEIPAHLKLMAELNQRLSTQIPLSSIREQDVIQAIVQYYKEKKKDKGKKKGGGHE
jgi:energy-coupling factor transport system ATP-binding protein